jgi:hypothetical protein
MPSQLFQVRVAAPKIRKKASDKLPGAGNGTQQQATTNKP